MLMSDSCFDINIFVLYCPGIQQYELQTRVDACLVIGPYRSRDGDSVMRLLTSSHKTWCISGSEMFTKQIQCQKFYPENED